MRRIVLFAMSTLTVLVLLFGYHTSTSSKAVGGETAFVSTAQAGVAGNSGSGQSAVVPNSVAIGVTPSPAGETPSPAAAAPSITTPAAAPGAAAATTPAATTPSAAPGTTASTSSSSAAKAAARTVTGDVTDTRWGPVQVQLTLSGSKITAVSVLQYPDGNGRDQEINANALPILVQETISAQSAKIDMVSGATVTSDGYLGSLQSALDKM